MASPEIAAFLTYAIPVSKKNCETILPTKQLTPTIPIYTYIKLSPIDPMEIQLELTCRSI